MGGKGFWMPPALPCGVWICLRRAGLCAGPEDRRGEGQAGEKVLRWPGPSPVCRPGFECEGPRAAEHGGAEPGGPAGSRSWSPAGPQGLRAMLSACSPDSGEG